MARKIKEGELTGSDPAKTGNMVGRYLRRYRRSVKTGESPRKGYDAAKKQVDRIGKKINKRQSSNPAYDGEYEEGVQDGKGDSYAAATGDYAQADKYEMASKNAPNPTDVKRRAKGKRPYRQRSSTELVRGARLALAERVLKEGLMTGDSAIHTGQMAGRYMRRLKKSIAAGETDPSVLDKKRDQIKRIKQKVGPRDAKNRVDILNKEYKAAHDAGEEWAKHPRAHYTYNPDAGEDAFFQHYKKGQGIGPRRDHDPATRSPNPFGSTDIKRRAKGKKPYK
mgnify:CR=1 FL=1|tara:strand:- start:199 stop:1038 length:840 start_codon:yes stop_codon:yes gene_type:complete